jgi:plastocyanin
VRSAHVCRGLGPLRRGLGTVVLASLGLAAAQAQAVHIIRLEADTAADIHRFVPARVTAKAGDVLRFRVTSGAPHSIAFQGASLSPATRQVLNAAMPNRTGDLSGPVLATNGAEYRMVLPALPPGRYVFYSLPHRAYEMEGELFIVK